MTKPALYLTLIALGKEGGNGMDGFVMWSLSEVFGIAAWLWCSAANFSPWFDFRL